MAFLLTLVKKNKGNVYGGTEVLYVVQNVFLECIKYLSVWANASFYMIAHLYGLLIPLAFIVVIVKAMMGWHIRCWQEMEKGRTKYNSKNKYTSARRQ